MEKKTEEIPIHEVVVKREMYPRENSQENGAVVFRYENLLKLKEKFPPIVVNFYHKKYYLIDGLHRLKANQNLGNDFIEATIYYDLPESKVLQMAVELNRVHGYRLELGDLIYSAKKLEKIGLQIDEISRIVGIDKDNLKRNFSLNDVAKPKHIVPAPSAPRIVKVNEVPIQWETCMHCKGSGKIRKK